MSSDPQQPGSAHNPHASEPAQSQPSDSATPGVQGFVHRPAGAVVGEPHPAITGDEAAVRAPKSDENPPWNGWDVLLVMVVAFVCSIIAGLVVGAIMASIAGSHRNVEQFESDLRFILPIQLAVYVGALGMMYQTVRVRYGQAFGPAVRWNWAVQFPWMWPAVGLVLAVIVQLAEYVLPMPKNLPMEKYFSTPLNAYLMGILGVLIAPLVEELFFRGFLYPVIARRFGLGGGILLTGAIFAAFHAGQLGYTWAPVLIMLIVGMSLTAVRAFTKSVAASTLTHIAYNFVLMATLWVASDHFRHLERMNR